MDVARGRLVGCRGRRKNFEGKSEVPGWLGLCIDELDEDRAVRDQISDQAQSRFTQQNGCPRKSYRVHLDQNLRILWNTALIMLHPEWLRGLL